MGSDDRLHVTTPGVVKKNDHVIAREGHHAHE
jgi:hypothetical protein